MVMISNQNHQQSRRRLLVFGVLRLLCWSDIAPLCAAANDTTGATTTSTCSATEDSSSSCSSPTSSDSSALLHHVPPTTTIRSSSSSSSTALANVHAALHQYSSPLDKKNNPYPVAVADVAAAMNPLGDSCLWLPPISKDEYQYDVDEEEDDKVEEVDYYEAVKDSYYVRYDEEEEDSEDDEDEDEDELFDSQDDDDEDDDDEDKDFYFEDLYYEQQSYYEMAGGDLGASQILEPGHEAAILQRLDEARDYWQNTILADKKYYAKVIDECYNDNEYCAYWAAVQGKCEEEFMTWHCPVVCQKCHELHIETKCPVDPNAKQAWKRGDLNGMFERLEFDAAFEQFTPRILSRPSYAPGDDPDTANYFIGPWVAVLENFLTDEECEHMIQLGHDLGYERSTDTGEPDETGEPAKITTTSRTSTNTFCQDKCRKDPIVEKVMERMAFITDIPARFSEDIQLLHYQEGQFYNVHHDLIEFEVDRMEGPRILTIFMYLNDVEEGGETGFDQLGLKIAPKRGRVVLWPNVMDSNPNMPDFRTSHEALPVLKGVKYGANAWIHLRDYLKPREMGC